MPRGIAEPFCFGRPSHSTEATMDATVIPIPQIPAETLAEVSPPVLEQIEAAESRNPRMRAALIHMAAGRTYREAAAVVGYASHMDVYRRAKQLGLIEHHNTVLKERHCQIAILATGELEKRLVDEPEKFSAKELAVVAGISTDKVLAFEKLESERPEEQAQRWGEVLQKLAENGGVQVKVTLERPTVPPSDQSR